MMHVNISRLRDHPIAIASAASFIIAFLALPTFIASVRSLPDKRRIMALNIVGIIAFTGWFAALTWAILGRQDRSLYDTIMQHRFARPLTAIVLAAIIGGGVWATFSALH